MLHHSQSSCTFLDILINFFCLQMKKKTDSNDLKNVKYFIKKIGHDILAHILAQYQYLTI